MHVMLKFKYNVDNSKIKAAYFLAHVSNSVVRCFDIINQAEDDEAENNARINCQSDDA